MKFTERYDTFINLCCGKIPDIQLHGLEENPKMNPTIIPEPRDWFLDSFDWYVGLKLLRGKIYGPFYRVEGDYFWPTIGNLYDVYSESQCFFGMERPTGIAHAQSLYNLRPDTPKDFVYEIILEMPQWPIIDDSYIFLGAVKNAVGFQVNPNGRVVKLLRDNIKKNRVKRFALDVNKKYDYASPISYTFMKQERKG
jgi:hypothetical protein